MLSLPLLVDVYGLYFMRFGDVFESLQSSGRGNFLIAFVILRQKYQQCYKTHKMLVMLLHFSCYSQDLHSVQFLFEVPTDISVGRKLCSSVQRRQALVEIQQCEPGAGIRYLFWRQRVRVASASQSDGFWGKEHRVIA